MFVILVLNITEVAAVAGRCLICYSYEMCLGNDLLVEQYLTILQTFFSVVIELLNKPLNKFPFPSDFLHFSKRFTLSAIIYA